MKRLWTSVWSFFIYKRLYKYTKVRIIRIIKHKGVGTLGKELFVECWSFAEAKIIIKKLRSQGKESFVECSKGKFNVYTTSPKYKVVKRRG